MKSRVPLQTQIIFLPFTLSMATVETGSLCHRCCVWASGTYWMLQRAGSSERQSRGALACSLRTVTVAPAREALVLSFRLSL